MNFKNIFNKKENLSKKSVIHHHLPFNYSECQKLEYLLPILDSRLNGKWTIEKKDLIKYVFGLTQKISDIDTISWYPVPSIKNHRNGRDICGKETIRESSYQSSKERKKNYRPSND